MAVVVRHKGIGAEFALVGSGMGLSTTSPSSLLFGALMPAQEEATTLAGGCDAKGEICESYSKSRVVVSIDGSSPQDLLGSP